MTRRIDASLVSDLWFFRIAAEHASFRRASADLAVTQSAVTQRIQRLEARLGITLFTRDGRGLRLTPEGSDLFRDIRTGFDVVAAGLDRARANAGHRTLSINCAPSFALEWLSPRLQYFSAVNPHVNITLFADMHLVDEAQMALDATDIVIRYGPEPPDGSHVVFDFPEHLMPVASPELVAGASMQPPGAPATLLHDAQPWPRAKSRTAEWDLWCEARGPLWERPKRDSFFNLAHIAYQSAAAGGGIAIGRALLVAPYLESGQLMQATPEGPVGGVRYFVSSRSMARDVETIVFIEWLQSEMDAAGARQNR